MIATKIKLKKEKNRASKRCGNVFLYIFMGLSRHIKDNLISSLKFLQSFLGKEKKMDAVMEKNRKLMNHWAVRSVIQN